MSSSKRRDEKKRRREKRLAKREERGDRALDTLINTFRDLSDIALPGSFPGACDASLERPDKVKFDLCTFAERGPGGDLLRHFERRAKQGILGEFPELDDWCMEEFFWHGAPDSDWNPIDQFLAVTTDRFPPAARRQIALWKEARIGLYQVGAVANDLVALRELHPVTLQPADPWIQAISLNIGGVNHYAKQTGMINLTYVAPWAPDQNIHCAMGYGISIPRAKCALATPLVIGMRDAKGIAFPLPWKVGKIAQEQFQTEWRRRDWYTWLKRRIHLPLQAAVDLPQVGPQIIRLAEMLTRSPEEAQEMGIHFAATLVNGEFVLVGATALQPVEVDSPTSLAFAEYRAYRKLIGPPPRTRRR